MFIAPFIVKPYRGCVICYFSIFVNMKETKLDILAIGAHPDDVELSCSATLAKEISLGKKVGI